MAVNFKKVSFGSWGLVLALGLLVGCNHARMEPNLPTAAVNTTTIGEGPERTPQTPIGVPPQNSGPHQDGNNIVDSGETCAPTQIKAGNIVKVLFLIDGSGSNFGQYGTVPSDPNKQWRIDTLGRFIGAHGDNPNIQMNFTLFKGTSARSYINIYGEPGFTSDQRAVKLGFRSMVRVADGGNTPYKAALRAARNMIAADLQEHAADNATYAVVMVSDGHPTDYKQVHDVIPDASAIKSIAPSRITLNSIYYSAHKVNASAPQYLKSIAQIGEGAFIIANSKKTLALNKVIRVPGRSCR